MLAFIRDSFLAGDPDGELEPDTPLLELGILNSLNTATLVAHVRKEYGLTVPLSDVSAATFRSVATITDMLHARLAA
ncbi:MAG: acyl carrier protein [Catenulispora sp.]